MVELALPHGTGVHDLLLQVDVGEDAVEQKIHKELHDGHGLTITTHKRVLLVEGLLVELADHLGTVHCVTDQLEEHGKGRHE